MFQNLNYGKLIYGFRGLDVGHRVHVQLDAVNVERGFIDFRKVGHSQKS